MKVAVVGNMNNGMFALTRHLRDHGIDAELFFARDFDHFHPKADTFDLTDLAFCHEVTWLQNGFYHADLDAIREDVRAYDVVLGTGTEAAALAMAGVPIYIYFPYGGDITTYAQRPRLSPRSIAQETRFLVKALAGERRGPYYRGVRRAVCTAEHLIFDVTNADCEELLAALPVEGRVHRYAWPFIYPATYRNAFPGDGHWDVHWRSAIDRMRTEFELLVMYHGRHEWNDDEFHMLKNTQNLVSGFAAFASQNPDVRSCLVTLEYGSGVNDSRRLIGELGLDDRVVWFPLMYRKDLMYLAHQADLCCGEFGRSYLTFGTILEAMSIGKPIVHHRDDALYEGPLYPLLNAREPGEIAGALAAFVNEPDHWRQKGREAQAWVDEHVIRRPLELICELLGARSR